jgi:hypothetical protein
MSTDLIQMTPYGKILPTTVACANVELSLPTAQGMTFTYSFFTYSTYCLLSGGLIKKVATESVMNFCTWKRQTVQLGYLTEKLS